MPATKQTRLVNQAAVRRFVRDHANGREITHVGAEVYAELDAVIRRRLAALIHRHPSAFRTLRP